MQKQVADAPPAPGVELGYVQALARYARALTSPLRAALHWHRRHACWRGLDLGEIFPTFTDVLALARPLERGRA